MRRAGSLFLWFSLFIFSVKSQAQSLADFFHSAQKETSPIIERQLAVGIAEERKNQVIGTVLPSVSAQSSNVWRDQADVGAFGEGYQHTALINLTQPLFQGGAAYHSIAIARRLPEIAKLEKNQEELRIFALVAQAFYQTLQAHSLRLLYIEQEKTLKNLVSALSERAKIGRSKATDVIAARSQLARVTAERSQVERQWVESEKNLRNLSGVKSVDQLVDSVPVKKLKVKPNWSSQVNNNPQIRANKLLLENAEKEIKVARGTYLPSVDANANYYLDRAGILRDSEWDVTLTAKWDLYNGGRDSSEVRVQTLESEQLRRRLQNLERTLNNDFESLQSELTLFKKVVAQMEEAVGLAKSNYEEHLKEAKRGLVSELDVLRVLEEYLQIRRNYEQQVVSAKMSYVQLQALAGELP